MSSNLFGFFECDFCEKRYLKEHTFNAHKCELRDRYIFITETKKGRFSYTIYKKWVKFRGYRKSTRDAFINSRYYTSILVFADFYYEYMLPDVDDYLKFVVAGDFLPQMWDNATVYERYITSFDDRVSPLKQADITFKYIDILSTAIDCTPAELFDYITPHEIIKLIQSRRLSPWVLLNSKVFLKYLNSLSDHEFNVLDAMVSDTIWLPRLNTNKPVVRTLKTLCGEFGI